MSRAFFGSFELFSFFTFIESLESGSRLYYGVVKSRSQYFIPQDTLKFCEFVLTSNSQATQRYRYPGFFIGI